MVSHRGLFNTNHRLSLAARDTLTRADLGRLEAHLADKAQTRGTPRETLRVHTLGFRQEAGKRGDTLTRAEDVQKAIFPVTPLFAYFLYTQIYKNRSQ